MCLRHLLGLKVPTFFLLFLFFFHFHFPDKNSSLRFCDLFLAHGIGFTSSSFPTRFTGFCLRFSNERQYLEWVISVDVDNDFKK